MAESSPTFTLVPHDPQQATEEEMEDSREAEEEGQVDLPLTVLRPFELANEPTPLDVVAGVLGQLGPFEEVVESRMRSSRPR